MAAGIAQSRGGQYMREHQGTAAAPPLFNKRRLDTHTQISLIRNANGPVLQTPSR